MTLTAETVGAGVGVLTVLGGAVSVYFGLLMRLHASEMRAMRDRVKNSEDREKEMERRLGDIERTYISRADHAEFRAELMNAVRDVGKSIDNLSHDVRGLVERVVRVESGA